MINNGGDLSSYNWFSTLDGESMPLHKGVFHIEQY